MRRFLIFILFLIVSNSVYAQQITKINSLPYENTPLYEYVKAEEKKFLESFHLLYFEEIQQELSPEDSEKIYNLVRNNDFEVCFGSHGELKTFCSLYLTLFLMGTQSVDLELFFSYPSPASDLVFLGKAIQFALNGETDNTKRMFTLVKDDAIKVFFSGFFDLFFSNEVVDLSVIPLPLYSQARIFLHFKDANVVLDKISDYKDLPPPILFLIGEAAFYKGEFLKATNCFLMASESEKIRKISLENAFYSALNDNNYKIANNIIDKCHEDTKQRLKAMLSIKTNKHYVIKDSFFNDETFSRFFLQHIKLDLQSGSNVAYAAKLNLDIGSEELLFLIALTKFIYGGYIDFFDYSSKVVWTNTFFKDSINAMQKRNFIGNPSIKRLIEVYSLFNYYPFNFFYANIIKNKNKSFAKHLYENVIKSGKKVKKEDLLNSYLNLANIYKIEKKYYIAIKLLEEALIFKQHEEKILMEMIRLYALKGDYEELKWRAERLFEQTNNPEHKKELQIFIDLCYEKLGIPKEADNK